MEYTVIYSRRKTLTICIKNNGDIVVKSPKYVSKKYIDEFIYDKREWIAKTRNKVLASLENKIVIDLKQENELKEKAKKMLYEKVKYYSNILQINPNKIIIGNAKSYWGYCDAKNNINFSWRLMLASDRAINYVVVHELTHIKHHNHSKEFWKDVEKIIPDYINLKKELKDLAKKL